MMQGERTDIGAEASWHRELAYRPLTHDHAVGELPDADTQARHCRYEVHLDRKPEPTLAMLIRPRELRRPALPG
jgi:hypothetical protein